MEHLLSVGQRGALAPCLTRCPGSSSSPSPSSGDPADQCRDGQRPATSPRAHRRIGPEPAAYRGRASATHRSSRRRARDAPARRGSASPRTTTSYPTPPRRATRSCQRTGDAVRATSGPVSTASIHASQVPFGAGSKFVPAALIGTRHSTRAPPSGPVETTAVPPRRAARVFMFLIPSPPAPLAPPPNHPPRPPRRPRRSGYRPRCRARGDTPVRRRWPPT